jgi:dihydroorotate dehydrogenase electron transfer subunit
MLPPALHRDARLLASRQEVPGYLELELECPDIARAAQPGQFLMLRAWPGSDPYLPRPFDILTADPGQGRLGLFLKVEGRGTELLRGLAPGAALRLTGPLGRPVDLEEPGLSSLAFLVRGAGAAAVVHLAERAAARGLEVFAVLSASTSARVVCRRRLEGVVRELRVATDDGSEGYGGLGSDLLDRLLERRRAEGRPVDRVYTCGSRRFARHVQELDRRGLARGFVFLEGLMACGLGDCHGCAVPRADGGGYWLVCRDGPHFPAAEVVLE